MLKLLEEIYLKYYKDVYRYLYSLSHDTTISEDLTSEVFLEIIKSLPSFKHQSDIKTWIFSIARNRWYNYLRKKYKEIKTINIDNVYEYELSTTNNNDINYIQTIIDNTLSNESALNTKVFTLRIKGYSFYEIAQECKISENSARVIYFRIKTKLKTELKKENLYD